ncbi:MAG: UPF0236 family transposase-like protein [Candidatus Limnocylindrales bacterium]
MQSIAVPVSLTLELQPEGADIGSLERAISAGLAEVGRQLWAEVIGTLERLAPAARGHLGCGGLLRANGRAPRRIVTLAGEVALQRRRYRCGACAAETVPLDALLGLEPRMQHTLGVRERALFLVTELSYAKTARTLDELRALGVSHGQLHRWVAEEGARIEAQVAARTEAVLGDHPERGSSGRRPGDVWVQADGTMVNDRASGTHLEVKVGLVFSGVERTGRDRRALLDRHITGATGSWTSFAERFTAACAALGVYEAERILFVSDGAAAIRWIRARSFPDAIELLDWYHLVEQLRFGIGRQHGTVLERAIGAAMPGDVDALLAILRAHARSVEGDDPEQALRCRAVSGYVAHNRRGIATYAIVPLASSGPMEKAVDLVVCRRFKSRGMSWFRRGVSHLLHLKLLRLNGSWDRYWAERLGSARRPWPAAVA